MLEVGLQRCTTLPILGNSTRAEVKVGVRDQWYASRIKESYMG